MPIEGSTTLGNVKCSVVYSSERAQTSLEKVKEEEDKLEELEEMREVIGIDALGWVPDNEHRAKAKETKEAIKTGLLNESLTESERVAIREHFPFDDHVE